MGRGSRRQEGQRAPDLKEARELAFKSSPVASIANWRSPVLLVHGDDDRNVPFQQTTDLVEKLRAQKVAFEELIFPDEIHDLLRWSDWIRAYRATAEFFDRRWLARVNGTKPAGSCLRQEMFLFRIGGTSRSATLNPRSGRGQRSIYIWENPKCSIKPRNFENRAQGFLQTAQEKLAAIRFNLLHG